jgi:hypothetical protein
LVLEKSVAVGLTDLEALERSQAFLLHRGFSLSGSVDEIRFRRGKFLSSFWALAPSMWPASISVKVAGGMTQVTLELSPPNSPTARELSYWSGVLDALARALKGEDVGEVSDEPRLAPYILQNVGVIVGVVAAVALAGHYGGLLAGAVVAIVTILGLYFAVNRRNTGA